jgi:hypothetical protein
MKREERDEYLRIAVSAKEKKEFSEAAYRDRLTLSAWIRQAAHRAILSKIQAA